MRSMCDDLVDCARANLPCHNPEVDRLALRVQGRTGACILVGPGVDKGTLERDLGERGDSAGDMGERSPLLDVEHRQPLRHKMTRHAQREASGRPSRRSSSTSARSNPRREPRRSAAAAMTRSAGARAGRSGCDRRRRRARLACRGNPSAWSGSECVCDPAARGRPACRPRKRNDAADGMHRWWGLSLCLYGPARARRAASRHRLCAGGPSFHVPSRNSPPPCPCETARGAAQRYWRRALTSGRLVAIRGPRAIPGGLAELSAGGFCPPGRPGVRASRHMQPRSRRPVEHRSHRRALVG